jgi:chromate transport protein ChrA
MSATTEAGETTGHPGSAFEVLRVFTKLGFTSFGGPIAHLGFFRTEFVARRGWVDEDHYADVVALSQFLPGPASSKVGIILGVLRAGIPGALAAWIGFTMPSALALILFGYGVAAFGNLGGAAWLHGLKIVAVAVVAQAVWGMARNLCPDRERATIAVAAAALALAVPSTIGQVGAIIAGGLIGWWFLPGEVVALIPLSVRISRWWSIASIVLFFGILIGLPFVVVTTGSHVLAVFNGFYRSGSLCSAAATSCCRCCKRRSSHRVGSTTTRFSPATARRRRCRDRSSPFRPILELSWGRHPTAGLAGWFASPRFSFRPSSWRSGRCHSGTGSASIRRCARC